MPEIADNRKVKQMKGRKETYLYQNCHITPNTYQSRRRTIILLIERERARERERGRDRKKK